MSDSEFDTYFLVQESQKGSAWAQDVLMKRYYPRVRKIVRRMMGPKLRNHADSLDVTQETFTTAVRKFNDFVMYNKRSLINWLAKLAQHSITDMSAYYKRQKRDSAKEVPLHAPERDGRESGQGSELEAKSARPIDRVIRDEEVRQLDACMNELKPAYRELIFLRDYLGLSFNEIAKERGSSSAAAACMKHKKAMCELALLVKKRAKD